MKPLLAAALLALAPLHAAAQGNQGADAVSSADQADAPRSAPEGSVAHVGAGTTDGTTTGFSEPEKKDGGGGGPVELTAELCVDAGDPAAEADCLSKVLGNRSAP